MLRVEEARNLARRGKGQGRREDKLPWEWARDVRTCIGTAADVYFWDVE